ncbi:MAG: uroporphyrinogen decarboxylase family protein [Candidatus Marinimicrobia bacterium]|nr:uroporphyrinogen decarboxylase family protein [Candidatus Neomarinimicrobiota bacterium]
MFKHLRTPNFERLDKTLRNQKADAIPLIELGIHPDIKKEIMGKPVITVQEDIDFMRIMGYDFLKVQPEISLKLNRKKVEDASKITDRSWSTEHEGLIKDWESFEAYPFPKREEINYHRLEEAGKRIPDDMGIIGQYGDIFTTVWETMGFETFSMLIYEEPALVDELFRRIGDVIYSMFEVMSQMDFVKVLWYSDDIAYSSGLLVHPDFLREHLFPWLKKIGILAKRRDIPFIYHSDGVLYDVMDDILACGVTALHPLEPISMDIAELKSRYGSYIALCGGIDVDQLTRGSKDSVRELTRKYIRIAGKDGGWAAGSSNSITEYIKTENYLTMVETVLKEGTY